jgi:uncharacterized membrane protein YeiH
MAAAMAVTSRRISSSAARERVSRLHTTFLALDALGLVVFTVIGCNVALGLGHGAVVAMVCGMVTGCAGGVLRDMLCGDVPLLLRREMYATVSLATGGLYVAGLHLGPRFGWPHDAMMAVAKGFGLVFRGLAIRHEWHVPTFEIGDDDAGR